MASWKDFYGTKMLSAKALGSKTITGKIVECEPITIKQKGQDEETKLNIKLDTLEDSIRLNNTNAASLAKVFGEDFTKWVGRKVEIKAGPQQYMGQATLGLFVTPIKK